MRCLGNGNGEVMRLEQIEQSLVWKLEAKQDIRESVGRIPEQELRGTRRECTPKRGLVKEPTEQYEALDGKEDRRNDEHGTTILAEDLILSVVRLGT